MKKKWILRHCDLDLWFKVINFNRVQANAISNHLAKTAFKTVYPFGWNFVHWQTHTQTDRHTDTHTTTTTHTGTNCNNHSTSSWRCGQTNNYFKKSDFEGKTMLMFTSFSCIFLFTSNTVYILCEVDLIADIIYLPSWSKLFCLINGCYISLFIIFLHRSCTMPLGDSHCNTFNKAMYEL